MHFTCGEREEVSTLGRGLAERHLPPRGKSPLSKEPIMGRLHQVATNAKEIIDGAVDREKALDVSKGFEWLCQVIEESIKSSPRSGGPTRPQAFFRSAVGCTAYEKSRIWPQVGESNSLIQ